MSAGKAIAANAAERSEKAFKNAPNPKKKKKKRRSQAPVALVYFITVLVFMALLAALSIYLLKEFNILDDGGDDEDAVISNTVFTNLYARVNSKGVLSDAAIIRVEPDEQKILVVPVSAMTAASTNKSQTMRDVFETGGMAQLKSEIQDTYDVTIDNYMSITNEAFESVADIFGGITYTPSEELYYLSQDNDQNDIFISKGELTNLDGRQIRLISQYPIFSNGKQGNIEFFGEALTSLLNNAFQQANITTDNLDNIYEIITENSDTDFTNDDFKLQKSYIKDMLASGTMPAEMMCPQGTWSHNDEKFEPSSEFKASLRERITTDVEETADSESSANN